MSLRIFLLANLINFFYYPVSSAQEVRQKDAFKFGPKIEWCPFLVFGSLGASIGQTYNVGPFIEFANSCVEVGLLCRFAHIVGVPRRGVDPVLRSKPIRGCPHNEGSIPLSLKSFAIPIIAKLYLGKDHKFCCNVGLDIAYIFAAKKEDPDGEFSKTPAYALLDEKDKEPCTEAYRKAYAVFNRAWQKRANKYISVNVKDIFETSWCVGMRMGLQYQMDIGLMLGFGFLFEAMGMKEAIIGGAFTLGYNLNKILKRSEIVST